MNIFTFRPRPLYPWGQSPSYPFNRWPNGEGQNLLLLPGTQPRIVRPQLATLTTITHTPINTSEMKHGLTVLWRPEFLKCLCRQADESLPDWEKKQHIPRQHGGHSCFLFLKTSLTGTFRASCVHVRTTPSGHCHKLESSPVSWNPFALAQPEHLKHVSNTHNLPAATQAHAWHTNFRSEDTDCIKTSRVAERASTSAVSSEGGGEEGGCRGGMGCNEVWVPTRP